MRGYIPEEKFTTYEKIVYTLADILYFITNPFYDNQVRQDKMVDKFIDFMLP